MDRGTENTACSSVDSYIISKIFIFIFLLAAFAFVVAGFIFAAVGYQDPRGGDYFLPDVGSYGSYLQGAVGSIWNLAAACRKKV